MVADGGKASSQCVRGIYSVVGGPTQCGGTLPVLHASASIGYGIVQMQQMYLLAHCMQQ